MTRSPKQIPDVCKSPTHPLLGLVPGISDCPVVPLVEVHTIVVDEGVSHGVTHTLPQLITHTDAQTYNAMQICVFLILHTLKINLETCLKITNLSI